LYDGVPIGLFRTTPDGRFVDANPPMVALLGFEDRANLDTVCLQDMYADKSDYELWKSTMDSESSLQNMEFRLRQRDGSLCWVRNRTHVVKDSEAQAIGYEGCLEDITVLKSAEAEQKKLIAELESKNAELARFTYSVSHDLKSPLITIKGFLGYLEKEAKEGNFDDFGEDLARITNAVDRMQSLLLELLELSRIGRIENEKVLISFEKIATEAASLVEGRLQERNVKVEIAHNLPSVFGDASRLREVVVNLVDNAAKFMGDQGNPRIEIDTRTDDGETVFFVRDNGIGIDPRYHKRIFGLFERLNPNTEGTGMGLTIVERIINVHGGRIWVESEGIGKGSSFCFTLPDVPVANDEYGVV
jgi:PAS domain S-box-containing protein